MARNYDKTYLNELIAKAKKSWEGVDVDGYMQNLRDFVDKEVAEKLSKEVTSCIMEQVKHNMKTIEERAKEAGIVSQYKSDYRYDARSVESGYIQGATEQKAIDEEESLKLESVWVKEAQINHNDVANYKQGYRDAVQKACNAFCRIGCPHETDDYDCLKDKCSAWKKFRRMMEE